MSPNESVKYPSAIIETGTSPQKALGFGEVLAQVKGKIDYHANSLGGKRWEIILTRGEIKDLLKAIEKTPGVKLISVGKP